MKIYTFKVLLLISFLLLFINKESYASPSARIQLIHNAADPRLAIVDIYLDNKKFDDISFRSATAVMSSNSGNHRISINDAGSSDSSDQQINAFSISIPLSSSCIFMLYGVVDTSQFAAPAGSKDKSSILLSIKRYVGAYWSSDSGASAGFVHAITDINSYTFSLRPNTAIGQIKNGEIIGGIKLGSSDHLLDIKYASNQTKSVIFPISSLAAFNVFVFSSGFQNPANNANGPASAIFYIDSTGGQAKELIPGGEIQFIHNTADTSLQNIDVYKDGVKFIDNIAFRNATPYTPIPLGNYAFELRKHAENIALYTSNKITVSSGKSIVAIANGVIDTAFKLLNASYGGDSILRKSWFNYSYDHAHIANRNISLSIYFYESGKSVSSLSPNNEVLFFQGITDAPFSYSVMGEKEAIPITPAIQYGYFHKYTSAKFNSGSRYLVTDETNGEQIGVYNFIYNISGMAGVMFASGFVRSSDSVHVKYVQHIKNKLDSLIIYNTYNNKGAYANLYVAWPDGSVDAGKPELRMSAQNEIEKPVNSFYCYPNPAKNKLNIVSANANNKIESISIYDLNGKELLNENLLYPGTHIELETSSINAGIYLLKVNSNHTQQFMRLIIE